MVVVESGLSFPAGLRVLVVDDDPTWLKILEKMLKKCSYEVTTCGLARKALRLLRERRGGFDIVISDVNMPDMDGFKLLEQVGLGMDLPVIMMSVDGETSRVMKGVQHGACDYLLKPIRMKELKNIWQHVLRKRMHEIRDKESHDNLDDGDDDGDGFQLFSYAADVSDGGHLLSCADRPFLKKRKDLDRKHGDRDLTDFSAKRPRVVWSIDLHQKFVKAVSQIGFDKVVPKKVLDMMNVPWLTRENIASHLQKYRLYLTRLGIEDEMKNSCGGGFKYSHQSPKDYGGGSGIQNPTALQRSEAGVVNFSSPEHKPPVVQSVDTKPYEIGPDGITTWPLPEPRDPFTSDISDVHITTCGPKMGLDNSVGSQKSKISYPEADYIRAPELTWSRQVQHSPSEFEYKPHQQVLEIPFANESKVFSWLKDSFCNEMTVHVPQQPDTCLCQRKSVLKRDNLGIIDTKLMSPDISNNRIKQPLDIFGLSANCSVDISQTTAQNGPSGFELEQRNHISVSESSTMGLDDTGFSEYNFPDFSNEGSPNLHVWETKIQLGIFW